MKDSWQCSPRVEEALWRAAEKVVGKSALAPRRLRNAVVERSRLYTSERERLASPTDVAADLAARAVFFSVADAPKIAVPTAELASRELFELGGSVLDIGAGCGAMLWGLFDSGAHGSMVAVDRDRRALDITARVASELGVRVEIRVDEVESYRPQSTFDLIVLGSVINEIDDPFPLVQRLLQALREQGALIIIEPALREQARGLHRLRDVILESRLANVYSPCLRGGTCPALLDASDWCHEDRPTLLPPRAHRLAVETSLRKHGLKFSYLVLRKDGMNLVADSVRAARVVSRLRKLKGKMEAFLCSEQGRHRVTLLKRNVDEGNRAFAALARGDVVLGVEGASVQREQRISRQQTKPLDSRT